VDKRIIRRRAILLALLLLVLAAVAAWYVRYLNTRDLGVPVLRTPDQRLAAPQYQYSISGGGGSALRAPLGVAVAKDGRVFVTDSQHARIEVFAITGQYLSQFSSLEGSGTPTRFPSLLLPVHVAINPVSGDVYVTDRGRSALFVFTQAGRFVREIAPYGRLGYKWKPNALAFKPDGSLYVADVFFEHQIWLFDPSGRTLLKFGHSGQVLDNVLNQPGALWFPNGMAVGIDGRLWVADSDNRRIQIFTPDGKPAKIVATSGHPRGLAFWRQGKEERLISVDALANFVTVYNPKGEELTQFGERGRGFGQFLYPNGAAVAPDGKILVTDRENDRVQVWLWPPTVTVAKVRPGSAPCLAALLLPLLLLPLAFLLRKRKFFVTGDFLAAMVVKEKLDLMGGRKRFAVLPATYEAFKDVTQGEIRLADILEPEEHSASDARDLMERYEIGEPEAIVLSMAKRKHVLGTEDAHLRQLAVMLGIKVNGHEEFIQENAG
jgi:DNA-binding beta-propeller fold protein YncE